jgi:type I restriction enzyme M protein
MSPADIVNKLWNYYNVQRDDLSACGHARAGGMSYGDYVEQLTYLLFLKMADERTQARA